MLQNQQECSFQTDACTFWHSWQFQFKFKKCLLRVIMLFINIINQRRRIHTHFCASAVKVPHKYFIYLHNIPWWGQTGSNGSSQLQQRSWPECKMSTMESFLSRLTRTSLAWHGQGLMRTDTQTHHVSGSLCLGLSSYTNQPHVNSISVVNYINTSAPTTSSQLSRYYFQFRF